MGFVKERTDYDPQNIRRIGFGRFDFRDARFGRSMSRCQREVCKMPARRSRFSRWGDERQERTLPRRLWTQKGPIH